jgi:hypothetical protein
MKNSVNLTVPTKRQAMPPEMVVKTEAYLAAEIATWTEDDTFAKGERQDLARRLAGNNRHSPTD